MGKFINPFTDVGFKKIFGQEVSKDLLIDFLNDLLVGERSIKDITFLDKELLPEYMGDRGMTLTELIASLAIAFILMSFLIRMYTYTGNMFETSASADDLRRTTQVVVDYLEDRISCAESLVISREELTGDEYGHEILFSRNGRIHHRSILLC